MTAPFASWSSVLHSCWARTVYFDDAVTHVVTPAHGLRATPLCDFDVVGVGHLPSVISGCSFDGPGGRHLFLRRS